MKYFHQTIATGLSALLIVLSPCLECYQAFGAHYAKSPSSRAQRLIVKPVPRIAACGLRSIAQRSPANSRPAVAGLPVAAGLSLELEKDLSYSSVAPDAEDHRDKRIAVVNRLAAEIKARFNLKNIAMPILALSLIAGPAATRSSADELKLLAAPAAQGLSGAQQNQTSSPVKVTATVIQDKIEFGKPFTYTVILENKAGSPIAISSLRASLRAALPWVLELKDGAKSGKDEILLAPGEMKSISYELIPFNSGRIEIPDFPTAGFLTGRDGVRNEINILAVGAAFNVPDVFPEGTKREIFNDIGDVLKPRVLNRAGLAGLGFLAASAAALGWFLTGRKKYLGLKPSSLPGAARKFEDFEKKAAGLSQFDFYTEIFEILSTALMERYSLELPAPGSAALKEAVKSLGLTADQKRIIGELVDHAQAFRSEKEKAGAEQRKRDAQAIKTLLGGFYGFAGAARGEETQLLGLAPLGLGFSDPWMGLAATPFVLAYLLWKFILKTKPRASSVPTLLTAPKIKSPRQRFKWLSKAARLFEVAATILALMGPNYGYVRQERHVPVTRTVLNIDDSGSMAAKIREGDKAPTRSEAAQEASRQLILHQRKGTNNLVAIIKVGSEAYLVSTFDKDSDALIGSLKELDSLSGSTSLGEGQMMGLELIIRTNLEELQEIAPKANASPTGLSARLKQAWQNVLNLPSRIRGFIKGEADLKPQRDPRAVEALKILKTVGLSEALKYLENYPDLFRKVMRPEEWKVLVNITDGDSNAGVKPMVVARMIEDLNEKHGFNVHLYFRSEEHTSELQSQ